MIKSIVLASVAAATTLAAGAANAGVSWHVGINLPVPQLVLPVPVPQVVVSAPQPVYYEPAPQPVYYQPAPVVYERPYYGPRYRPVPVVVAPRYYYGHSGWDHRDHGWRRD